MSKIFIGKAGKKDVALDLDILLRTRLLVQANSGGGKSWLLRRLAEQLFGKIPVIIIDPEGEFATLREQFGYVLVGKGGETPADSRSAALVAHKLLELRASAVCDLYEMKPSERHHWVRLFLEALIDAPKNLWRPTIVMVDEAHTFCPEKGAGESEASEAMTALPTRGRKRRFCAVWATQRLGKLRKDASAELLNRLIGPTFEDVDLKRAADLLSIRSEDRRKFDAEMRVLEPGNFFALGRAICKERLLIRVGVVTTSHEIEDAKHGTEPPPAPDKVKLLLPKLKDLPQAAEEQAKTVNELKHEIRSLKAQMRSQPLQKVSREVGPNPVADPRAIERAVREVKMQYDKQLVTIHASEKALRAHGGRLAKDLLALAQAAAHSFGGKSIELPQIKVPNIPKNIPSGPAPAAAPRPAAHGGSTPPARSTVHVTTNDGDLTPQQKRILAGLAEFEALGQTEVPRSWVGAAAGQSFKSSTFEKYVARLRALGLIDYAVGKRIRLTDHGRAAAPAVDAPLTTEEIQKRSMKLLTPQQQALLAGLVEVHPEFISREELGEKTGQSHLSSTFEKYLAALRSSGMIEYGPNKTVKCADWLFID